MRYIAIANNNNNNTDKINNGCITLTIISLNDKKSVTSILKIEKNATL